MRSARRSSFPGQYVPNGSRIHRLPPWVKLAAVLAIAVGGLLVSTPVQAAVLALLAIALYAAARLGWQALLQDSAAVALQAPLVLLVFLWRDGTTGIAPALLVSARLALISIPGLWLQRTTAVSELGDALSRILPVRLSFVVAMGLHFLPLLARDAREIYLLQRLRGARIGSRDLLDPRTWPEACHSLAVPLLVRALRLADQIAVAAQYRGLPSRRLTVRGGCDRNPVLLIEKTPHEVCSEKL
jgi:energy-coupling factor transport system permease protein